MKVWVTKYALSEGVFEEEVEDPHPNGMVRRSGEFRWSYLNPGDYYHSREKAAEKAEAMKVKKIASLKKQIAKLEKLNFGGDIAS